MDGILDLVNTKQCPQTDQEEHGCVTYKLRCTVYIRMYIHMYVHTYTQYIACILMHMYSMHMDREMLTKPLNRTHIQ